MSMTQDGQALGNAHSTSSTALVHPEDLGSCPAQKQEDQHLAAIFASAALQNAPGLTLGQVMFDNISYGLLFAMFTELSVECTQQSAALTIVSKNMCFQGTKFTASSEGARLLTQVYSKRISGPVFARKKLAWRKGEKGAG